MGLNFQVLGVSLLLSFPFLLMERRLCEHDVVVFGEMVNAVSFSGIEECCGHGRCLWIRGRSESLP